MLNSEFVPARTPSSDRLLLVLHGLGDSAAGYSWLPGALNLPWLNYRLVNAPDAYYTGYSWFDFAGDWEPGVSRSRKQIMELLDADRAAGFPSERTTLFGFSQGCLMTIDVGLRYPHRLAGLVGISGAVHDPDRLLASASTVATQQRLLFTHGTFDPIIPCAAVRPQVEQLRRAGIRVDWHEFAKAHTIAGEEELTLIRDFIRAGYEGE